MKQVANKKFRWKSLIRLVLLILCGATLGLSVYMINANNMVGNRLPMPFGYGAAVVLSGSMEPTFSEGCLLIVKEKQTYEMDDIVVYEEAGKLIVHRIIDMEKETVTTKGDANNIADEPIAIDDIRGEAIYWIPKVGLLVNFLKTPIGVISILIISIAMIEIPNRREVKHDEEERQKILDEIERLRNEK